MPKTSSNFRRAAGGLVVQPITIVLSETQNTHDATISAVDLSKSYIESSYECAAAASIVASHVRVFFVNSTTVRASRGANGGAGSGDIVTVSAFVVSST
jgi:hypothetical protein